ncbi:16524_t:CDS:2 [Gigaspora margarita]|uniref:16524_t:CDS:1 n=1 Tax=Gigaspora margarita TaxID=4874 RepID=A0ABN7VDD0_GIGMA|nr:16524_t:CDS:2 [Gigaspora margarita]
MDNKFKKQVYNKQYYDQLFTNHTESWTISKNIINLEPAKTSKFQYIIEWTIYKLTKSDKLTLAHKEFAKIKLCLNVLSSEQLFEKHIEYGPDILIYINNNLVNNQPLKKQFNDLLHIAYEFYYNIECKNKELLSEFIYNSIQLSKEAEDYLLVRLIKTYMQSRQWSWQRFKEYIPEKGLSSLQENVKAMNIDLKNNAKKDAKPKMKLVSFKKEMLSENFDLALG